MRRPLLVSSNKLAVLPFSSRTPSFWSFRFLETSFVNVQVQQDITRMLRNGRGRNEASLRSTSVRLTCTCWTACLDSGVLLNPYPSVDCHTFVKANGLTIE